MKSIINIKNARFTSNGPKLAIRGNFTLTLFIIAIYIIASARSCNDEEISIKEDDTLINEVELSMTADNLSSEALSAFEEKAVQKQFELFEYLSLLNNDNTAPEFRKGIFERIQSLFAEGFEKLKICNQQEFHLRVSNDFKLKFVEFPDADIDFKVRNIQSIHPPELTKERTYKGDLEYFLDIIVNSGTDSTWLRNCKMTTTYQVKKSIKYFGSDSLDVWQVYLSQ